MTQMSDHVTTPPMDDDALDAQLLGIRNKQAARAARRRSVSMGVTAAVVVGFAMVGAWWAGARSFGPASPVDGDDVVHVAAPRPELPSAMPAHPVKRTAASLDASSSAAAEVATVDGALMRAAPGARVEACGGSQRGACWNVQRGTVTFEPAADAPWIAVQVGTAELRGHAATFVVTRKVAGAVHQVALRVDAGEVEVFRATGDAVRISAGESLTFETSPERVASATSTDHVATSENGEQSAVAAADTSGASLTPEASSTDLWNRAKRARRSGEHGEAADLYAELLAEHGDDPNAGLAALELARLRMDTLDDVTGSIAPLRRAMRDRRASIREDALARLVRAHERLGQLDDCRRRRNQYLASHPAGVHTTTVERACEDG